MDAQSLLIVVVVGGAFGYLIASLLMDVVLPLLDAMGKGKLLPPPDGRPLAMDKFFNALMGFVIVLVALYLMASQRETRRNGSVPSGAPPEERVPLRKPTTELQRRA